MQPLPSYMILDFFDWVRENNSSDINIGFVRECTFCNRHISNTFEGLEPYAKQFINQRGLEIKAWELTKSLYFYLNNSSSQDDKKKIESALYKTNEKEINITDNYFLELMVRTSDICLEIEFLEWLIEIKLSASDVLKMPLSVFKAQAREYLKQRYGDNYQNRLDKLVKFFKFDNPSTLFDRLKNSLPKRNYEKYKSLRCLYNRYTSPNIFKCFFLSLSNDEELFSFIRKRWVDLNSFSGDYLDIYYSIDELNKSGYQIAEEFKKLDIRINELPCLVLWENGVDKARFIEIRELSYEPDLFHIIQTIVQNIKDKKDFESVHKEAVKMANEKRNKHNHDITGTVNISDIKNSNINIESINTGRYKESITTINNFSSEAVNAIKKIKESKLNKNQKNTLINLIKEAEKAIQDEDESAKVSCKKGFVMFLNGAGEIVKETLKNILPPLLLSFFGLNGN